MMGMKMKRYFFLCFVGMLVAFDCFAGSNPLQTDQHRYPIPGRTVLVGQTREAGLYQPTIDAYCNPAVRDSHSEYTCPIISKTVPCIRDGLEYAPFHLPENYKFFYYGAGETNPTSDTIYAIILGALEKQYPPEQATWIAQNCVTAIGMSSSPTVTSQENSTPVFFSNPTGYQTHSLSLQTIVLSPVSSVTK